MSAAAVAGELLDAIAERDFARIEACFAKDAAFQVLTPQQLRQHETAVAVGARYRYWLESFEDFELVDGDVEEIADRVRIRYRFRGRDPEKGWQLKEHTGYAKMRDGRIVGMNVTCTGFRPTQAP
jgi:ketosteroid isomerase-like protein